MWRRLSFVLVLGLVAGLTLPAIAVDGPVSRVYVAAGRNFPDALSGSVLAALTGAPVLLTEQDELPDGTRAEIERLQPHEIVIFGGAAAVSDGVFATLDELDTGGGVRRIAGDTRYDTAAAISDELAIALPYAQADQSCPSGQLVTGIDGDGSILCGTDPAALQRPAGVVVVAQDGTGDFDNPRDAAAFVVAQSAETGRSEWLIEIAPGEYDLGDTGVSFVGATVRGAGTGQTILTSSQAASTLTTFGGTVALSGAARLEDMTVENTANGAARAIAIGIFNNGELDNVEAVSDGSNDENVAVHLSTVSGEIHDSTFTAEGASLRNIAMASVGSQPSFDLDVYDSSLRGGAFAAFENCTANDPTGYGVLGRQNTQTLRFHDSRICGSFGGIHIASPPAGTAGSITVTGGYVKSSSGTAGSSTLETGTQGAIRVANSQLAGTTLDGGGNVTCRDAYTAALGNATC